MQHIFKLQPHSINAKGTVVTIGNFDGVHLGHRALIGEVCKKSKDLGLSSVVMTFDPHPSKVLFPERGVRSLFDLEDRIEQIALIGPDWLVIEPFNRELSQLPPEEFFQKYVLGSLRTKALIVGHDFSFGRNRTGTLDLLKEYCRNARVTLDIMEPVRFAQELVSSSVIRNAILQGEVERARHYLARPFYMKGVVEKGAGRGKKMGFATANLFTKAESFPKEGVYISKAYVRGAPYRSVTNIGKNPTFTDKLSSPLQVETHILNFDEDIYGETLKVEFLKYLRSEKKFSSVDDLVGQIRKDVEQARSFYTAGGANDG